MTWFCSCGLKNSGLVFQCVDSEIQRFGPTHYQATQNEPDFFMAWMTSKELNMTPQEELYAKFYNGSRIEVKDMDLTALREHRDILSQIAFEAKARLAAADDELRERKAKVGIIKKEWTITPIGPDQVTSDAINAIKVRKERMSKMDRMRAQLLTAGIDEDTVNEMIANLERKATEKTLKTVTFTKQTVETAAVVVKADKPADNGDEPKVFNPANLVFGRK